ncbi:HEPN domain-containing protein [Limibacillus halophilus]|uniref:Apea-like HEPN domain-containing protein n=1 Tax=Limibacillus halophilus TaxID=1579333 RepID=A0A839SXS5_9PROT|nr:HEPN domain-containing protein [Limibacillus halophilus]MBB3066424.1 hypothetical protein [Limibacillus halophilus]
MRTFGNNKESYLLINGIKTHRVICLSKSVKLLPANKKIDFQIISDIAKDQLSFGIMCIFLASVESQILISENDPKKHAVLAWNSLWDAVLLSALYNVEAVCNFQSSVPYEKIKSHSQLSITNYHLRGLVKASHQISEDEAVWLEDNFHNAQDLLDDQRFRNAVHCMATYRWHSNPRAQLAILWSGIEGIFGVQNEISFRLSLFIANYLEPNNEEQKKKIFSQIRELYVSRSKAIHGSKINSTATEDVEASAICLKRLIYKCIQSRMVPDTRTLAP